MFITAGVEIGTNLKLKTYKLFRSRFPGSTRELQQTSDLAMGEGEDVRILRSAFDSLWRLTNLENSAS